MVSRRAILLLPLLAAACGDEEASQDSFPFPSYTYLTPLRLNVASIQISDHTPPVAPNSIEALAPVRPVDALKQMATDRLIASGSFGRADFVIDQANLRRVPGGIEGTMAVHLDVYAGTGPDRAGYAEARVSRRRRSTDTDENPRAVLYAFVKQMMDDMNVEFEYQVKRSLKDWLQLTAGAAPLPAAVESQPLGQPGSSPVSPPGPATAPPAAAPLLLPALPPS